MTPAPSIRAATVRDRDAVHALLRGEALPLDGLPEDLAHFLVAEQDGALVGVIGLEPYGEAGLLRSAAVAPAVRGTGLGARLVTALVGAARAAGIRELTLLTTTAEGWFPRFGFERIAREEAAASLQASAEFRGACPASATTMRLRLAE